MEYLNGELAPAEHAEFEAHLAECPWCVAYLQTYRDTIRLGKAAFAAADALPADVPEELVQAILAVRGQKAGT
jgi:anti-sigma factor RsiW